MQNNITSLFPPIHIMEPNLSTPIWTQIPSTNFTPRYNHASIAINHYIITFGGNNGQNYLNDVLIFDTHKNTCQEFTIFNTPPQERAFHSMCKISDDQIIIYGGYSGSQVLDDFHILKIASFDPPLAEWMESQTEGRKLQRYGHSAHIYKNQMYIVAGFDEKLKPTKDIWCLNLDSFSWSECDINSIKPGRRAFHSSVLCGDVIYIFGGLVEHFSSSDFWRYNIETMKWELLSSGRWPPSGRRNHTMQEAEGMIYLFGGRESTWGPKFDVLYSYNIEKGYWNQLKQQAGIQGLERFCHSQVCVEGKVYILGGQSGIRLASAEIWQLEINEYTTNVQERAENKVMEIESSKIDMRKRDDEDCDVAFEVEGEVFRAHKEVLEAKCKYFYHMFASGMVESKMDRIKINEIKSTVFNAILEEIYNGKVELNEELAVDLLGISDQYLLKDLRKTCESYLANCLRKETVAKRIEQADHFGAGILRDGALRFLMENLEEVSKYSGREEISKEVLLEVIMGLQQKMRRK